MYFVCEHSSDEDIFEEITFVVILRHKKQWKKHDNITGDVLDDLIETAFILAQTESEADKNSNLFLQNKKKKTFSHE